MPAIGIGMLWGGYTLLYWGWCRIKGYDIGLGDLVVPGRYTGSWPPPLIDDTNSGLGTAAGGIVPGLILPPKGGTAGKGSSSGSSSGSSGKGSSSGGGKTMWV